MLVASVGINFANIIGRYFFSVSLSWAEEAMLFLMIGCVFLGASQAGWLGRHIRMDVVISLLPPRARKLFDVLSDIVTIATCIAVAVFAWPVMTMFYELDQRSETANIPLVIPQSAVPIGLLLMAVLIAARLIARRHPPRRHHRQPRRRALKWQTFVYFILPAILLILGLPIFVVLLLTSFTAIVFVAHVPTEAVQTYMFGSLDNFPLLAVPFFVLAGEIMGRGGIAERVVTWVVSIIGGVRGSLGGDDGGVLGTVRGHGAYFGRHRGRHRPAVVSVADQAWLQRALRHQPDHLLGRGRGDHSAVDRDDPLRDDGRRSRRSSCSPPAFCPAF